MPLYFIANSIYQFAYALPVYRKTGGVFVVHNRKKYRHFKKFIDTASSDLKVSPKLILVPRNETHNLKGVLLFLANTIQAGESYTQSITIFHEHGTSDKRYEGGDAIAIEKLSKYDYIFLSGPKNHARLIDIGLQLDSKKLVEIGCLRFDDYLAGKFDRTEEEKKLKITDRSRKNILYAPTWKFGNGTLRKQGGRLIDEITKSHNLILRPHYHDRKYALLLYWIKKLRGKKHIYFSYPQDLHKHDTYAAFVVSDLLISDLSSVIYEYLITFKPILVMENDFKQRHQMPTHLDILNQAIVCRNNEPLLPLVETCFDQANEISVGMKELLHNCFYAADGGSVDNVVHFLSNLRSL